MKQRILKMILPAVLTALQVLATPLAADEITWRASGKQGAVASGQADAVAAGIQLLEVTVGVDEHSRRPVRWSRRNRASG